MAQYFVCHEISSRTTLAERGVRERFTQQLLGHADSRTTREIHTHVSERTMGEATQC
jgi:integrase